MNRRKVVSSQDREGEPNFQEKGQNSFFLKVLTETFVLCRRQINWPHFCFRLSGEYGVELPDGRTQIVTYHADHEGGFVADVK